MAAPGHFDIRLLGPLQDEQTEFGTLRRFELRWAVCRLVVRHAKLEIVPFQVVDGRKGFILEWAVERGDVNRLRLLGRVEFERVLALADSAGTDQLHLLSLEG